MLIRFLFKVMPVLLVLTFIISNAKANTPEQQLKSLLSVIKSLSAKFDQAVIAETGIADKQSNGLFLLQRPGKFRWDYQVPYQQTIVSNGTKVWFYDADLEQVTIKKLDLAIGSTPALLLSGQVDLEKNFDVKPEETQNGLMWIKLLPKTEDSTFKYIRIGMRGQTLGAMEMSDSFGQLTQIIFSDVKINPAIDPGSFHLQPPPGVDVFEE